MERGRMKNDKMRLDKTIGENIRREREVRRITREELAEIIDLTVSHLGLIERGERGATSVTIEKIVKAFNVTIDHLFSTPSKAISARERRVADKNKDKSNSNIQRQKVEALISHLSEAELEVLTYTIKGIVGMRKTASADNEAIASILDNVE